MGGGSGGVCRDLSPFYTSLCAHLSWKEEKSRKCQPIRKSVWWTVNSRIVRRNFSYHQPQCGSGGKRFLAETRSCTHAPVPKEEWFATPSSGPQREITRVRSSRHSHNIRSPLVKIVKHPISKVNRSQISNIKTCHLVKHPIPIISFAGGQSYGANNLCRAKDGWVRSAP